MSVIPKHLQYYTRKAAQYSALRRRWPHRYKRLIAYKAALTERLRAENDGGG